MRAGGWLEGEMGGGGCRGGGFFVLEQRWWRDGTLVDRAFVDATALLWGEATIQRRNRDAEVFANMISPVYRGAESRKYEKRAVEVTYIMLRALNPYR